MRLIILIISSFLFVNSYAQVSINEVCSDNENIIADEEGDYEDWIEIFNNSNVPINLQGYFLSDDEEDLDQWSFPNVEIPAFDFILVFASGKDFLGTEAHTNFKISKNGETIIFSNSQGIIIDQLIVPALEVDQSYGRQPDGSEDLEFFFDPTPKVTNIGSPSFNFANPPNFQNEQFFDLDPIEIAINCDQPNCQVYYTIDGSVPDENSILYNGPFSVDTSTCIRAASVTPDFLLSKPSTRTFFVNEDHRIPVLAISTTPDNLWAYEDGIFVKGPNADTIHPYFGANFWSDRIIPVHMEYFIDETLAVEYPLAAKVHGGSAARTKPMKPLRLMAKGSYGTTLMDFPFFNNRTNTKFERLVLRNASGDYNICHMRDEFLARFFIDEELHFDGVSEQPIVVYLNGTYYGVMHLREKVDRYNLQYNNNIDPDNIDLLEEDSFIVNGDFTIFDAHEDFVINNDLSNEGNFEIAASYFNLESLSDYVIAQTFVNNTDWPNNNIKYWREKKDGAKWRYILFDLDVALALQGYTKASINSFGLKMNRDDVRMIVIFKSFLENTNFRHFFINRYADLTNSSFREERFNAEVYRARDEIDHDMKRHLPMWRKGYDNWYNNEIPKLNKFATERPMYARQYIGEYFNLLSQDQITINTFPENAGDIQINTIELTKEQLPWDGFYFNEVPIQITVKPELGLSFSHWESNYSNTVISSSPTITVNPRNGEKYTAIFNHDVEEPMLDLFPNPALNEINLKVTSPRLQSLQIKVYDAIGRLVITDANQFISTGDNFIKLNLDQLDEGTYFIHLIADDFSIGKKFVRFLERE